MDFAKNFGDIVGSYSSRDKLFYNKKLTISTKKIYIIGLDSAWMSSRDGDNGNLLLGDIQVRNALNATKDADLRIAIMHHPFNWFKGIDLKDTKSSLCKGCDFILHGHMHDSEIVDQL